MQRIVLLRLRGSLDYARDDGTLFITTTKFALADFISSSYGRFHPPSGFHPSRTDFIAKPLLRLWGFISTRVIARNVALHPLSPFQPRIVRTKFDRGKGGKVYNRHFDQVKRVEKSPKAKQGYAMKSVLDG